MDQNQPTPTPAPVVVPKTPWYQQPWLASLASPLLVAAALIGYDQFIRPKPTPYTSPVEQAAKTYYDTLGSHYHLVAMQVRGAQLTDQNSTVDALAKHAQPLANALESAAKPNVDQTSGKFINAPAVADMLDSAAKQMGAKF